MYIRHTIPPDATAMSFRVFFLLSPNPGALTATTCRPAFSLMEKENNRLTIIYMSLNCTTLFKVCS